MGLVQRAARGRMAIAFLGDGERHNRDLRLTKFLNNGGQGVQLCVQAFMDGADDNRLIAFSTFLQHGKQMILRAQLAHQHITAEEADLTNPPVAAFFIQHPVC